MVGEGERGRSCKTVAIIARSKRGDLKTSDSVVLDEAFAKVTASEETTFMAGPASHR